jgi:hypothetical protein
VSLLGTRLFLIDNFIGGDFVKPEPLKLKNLFQPTTPPVARKVNPHDPLGHGWRRSHLGGQQWAGQACAIPIGRG